MPGKIIRAESIDDAVRIATDLKTKGHYNWFRGQRRNWDVVSTRCRIDKLPELTAASGQVGRFFDWLTKTPGLEELVDDSTKAWAVAQHYGLPSNYIDFTTSPDVAGTFASDDNRVDPVGEGTIICLNTDELINFCKTIALTVDFMGRPQIEIIQMDVTNLWRLQAQHGLFLYCSIGNFEQLYRFDRILFPCGPKTSGLTMADIMPERESRLEILLKHYFMGEQLIKGNKAIEKFIRDENVPAFIISRPESPWDESLLRDSTPPPVHGTWNAKTTRDWIVQESELFRDSNSFSVLTVTLDSSVSPTKLVELISLQVSSQLSDSSDVRLAPVKFSILSTRKIPVAVSAHIERVLGRQWDGMRTLPYTNEQIARATAMLATLEIWDLNKKWSTAPTPAHDELLGRRACLEFGPNDLSYSRGYTSENSLKSALRPDLETYLHPDHVDRLMRTPEAVFEAIRDPSRMFLYDRLVDIFAREVIPTQLWLRDDRAAILYSPARLTILGLA